MKILFFSWKYIVWPIKWLEISPGMWILNQNFETNISLKFICKYMQKLILFCDFCKNFQGKFFFKGLHQFSTINCTYSYKSLPLGIFLNSYLVKAHCDQLKKVLVLRPQKINPGITQTWVRGKIPSTIPSSYLLLYIYPPA